MKRNAARVAKEIANVFETCEVSEEYVLVPRSHLTAWMLSLAAPPRKPRTKDPWKAERKATTVELDRLCRAVVFLRDGDTCRRCGRPAVDWSHCYSRRFKWLRWDLDNSWASCKGCHLAWHHRPAEGTAWWCNTIGRETYDALVLRAAKPRKTQTELVKLHLEAELRNLRPI